MYRPLPPEVTIRKSQIEGLGLFATCDMQQGYDLGISHIASPRFQDEFIRTPLGGFINHSTSPNCQLRTARQHVFIHDHPPTEISELYEDSENTILRLLTSEYIVSGTELTTYYSLYKISTEEII